MVDSGKSLVYVNERTKKYHKPDCIHFMKNGDECVTCAAEQAVASGCTPCTVCHPRAQGEELKDAFGMSEPPNQNGRSADNKGVEMSEKKQMLPGWSSKTSDEEEENKEGTAAPVPEPEPVFKGVTEADFVAALDGIIQRKGEPQEHEATRQVSIPPTTPPAEPAATEQGSSAPPQQPEPNSQPIVQPTTASSAEQNVPQEGRSGVEPQAPPEESKPPASQDPTAVPTAVPQLDPVSSQQPILQEENPPKHEPPQAPRNAADLAKLLIRVSLSGPTNVDQWMEHLASKNPLIQLFKTKVGSLLRDIRIIEKDPELEQKVERVLQKWCEQRGGDQQLVEIVDFTVSVTFPHPVRSSKRKQGKEVRYHEPSCDAISGSKAHIERSSEKAAEEGQTGATCCHPIDPQLIFRHDCRRDIAEEICVAVTPEGVLHNAGCGTGFHREHAVKITKLDEFHKRGKNIAPCCEHSLSQLLQSYQVDPNLFPVKGAGKPDDPKEVTALLPGGPDAAQTSTPKSEPAKVLKLGGKDKAKKEEKGVKMKKTPRLRARWVFLLAVFIIISPLSTIRWLGDEAYPKVLKVVGEEVKPRVNSALDFVLAFFQGASPEEESVKVPERKEKGAQDGVANKIEGPEDQAPPVKLEGPTGPTGPAKEKPTEALVTKAVSTMPMLIMHEDLSSEVPASEVTVYMKASVHDDTTVVWLSIRNDGRKSHPVSIHRDDIHLVMEESDRSIRYRIRSFEGPIKWIVGYLERGTPMYPDKDPVTNGLIWKSGIVRMLKPGATLEGELVFDNKIDLLKPISFKFSDLEGRVRKMRYAPEVEGG